MSKPVKYFMRFLLGVLLILLIYGINRFVTREIEEIDQTKTQVTKSTAKKEVSAVNKKQASATEAEKTLPDASAKDWNLVLVGPENKLKKEIDEKQLDLVEGTDMQLDKRIIKSYEQMREAAQKAGHSLVLISAYRSVAYQKQVFDQRVAQFQAQGLSKKEATQETLKTSTEPHYSEHHTGLAFDVVDEDWQKTNPKEILDQAYGKQPGGKWLAEHAEEYGFILRYPEDGKKITKINYEPWHFRYVGTENAEYMVKHDLTLEEYLEQINKK